MGGGDGGDDPGDAEAFVGRDGDVEDGVVVVAGVNAEVGLQCRWRDLLVFGVDR